jgi:hypothetical protein
MYIHGADPFALFEELQKRDQKLVRSSYEDAVRSLALTIAAVAACALPARRAARLDPIDAMRGGSQTSRAR